MSDSREVLPFEPRERLPALDTSYEVALDDAVDGTVVPVDPPKPVVGRLPVVPVNWQTKAGRHIEIEPFLFESASGSELRERLGDLLAADKGDDRFLFEVGPPQALDVGFRFSLTASMAGKTFASVRLDVAARGEELLSTEKLQVPGALPTFDRLSPPQVEVAAPVQHFAEKLHALTRDHGDRLNTRVRDLVDLMLLIELELVRAPEVLPAVRHVFESRGMHPVPGDLPDPPAGWARDYAAAAAATSLRARTVDEAMSRLRSFWHDAHTA
jgi:hypothetical protein